MLEKELLKRDAGIRDALRAAYRTVAAKRTPAQLKLLKDNPSVEKLSSGSLYLYDTTYGTHHADEVKAMLERRHPDGLQPPNPVAIAYHLVKAWVEMG